MLTFFKKFIQFILNLFGARDVGDGNDKIPPPVSGEFPYRASEVSGFELAPGFDYTIQEADAMTDSNALSFERVAEHFGMHRTSLREFNQKDIYRVGDEVYIPSMDELRFMEYCRHYDNLDEAFSGYLDMPPRPNRAMLDAARYRGAREIGASYATISTTFYSPNNVLAGASERRSEVINGQREYQVNWGRDIWKCNVFMHDCTYHAGYEPDVRPVEKHYIRAGKLHYSEKFEQIDIEDITPGCVIQLFGGESSEDSHNMVLMSFIERKPIDVENLNVEEWIFKAMGAEKDRVAVSIRRHFVIADRDEMEDGYKAYKEFDLTKRTYLRLFKPLYEREVIA